MQKHSFKIDEPTQIYYNIDIVNNDTSNEGKQLSLEFDETRTGDFLKNPADYFLSVVRFQLQSPSLPVFIPQIELNQVDINKTIYTILVYWNGNPYTTTIHYVPENLGVSIPSSPLVNQDVSSTYYHILSYAWWTNMMNTAFNQLATDLNTASAPSAIYTVHPFFRFDGSTNLIEYYVPDSWISTTEIFFNGPLQTLMSVFPFINYGKAGKGGNPLLIYELQTFPTDAIKSVQGVDYRVLGSENSPTSLWNPIQSIVFTSTKLPVLKSFTGAPKIFNSSVQLSSHGNNDNLTSILTDFTVPFASLNTYKPNINYEPQGEYRLTDLMGNDGLNTVHLHVFWKDKFGNLNKFLLNSNCSASLKIMFRKKSFNGTL